MIINSSFTKHTFITLSIIFVLFHTLGCANVIGDSENNYKITDSCIEGRKEIRRFEIAQLKNCALNEVGYPVDLTEDLRVYCELQNGTPRSKVYFYEFNDEYKWSFCTADFSYMQNHSLKNLSEKEKLARIHSKGADRTILYDTMPFKFEKGKCYHLFGLEGSEGSYFIYLDNNKLVVRYYAGAY